MSLLNQMLRDLEQRQASPAVAGVGVLKNVVSADTGERPAPRPWAGYVQWSLLASTAMLAGYSGFPLLWPDAGPPPAVSEPPAQLPRPLSAEPAPVPLRSIESLKLASDLQLPTPPAVPAETTRAGSPVRPPAPADRLLRQAMQPAPARRLEPPGPPASASLKKTRVATLQPQELADELYQEAMSLLDAEREPEADQLLLQVLQTWPAHARARRLLVSRRLSAGDFEAAGQYLRQGLVIDPGNIALIGLNARLLASNGHLDSAVLALRGVQPDMHRQPEHYALLAALLRQSGDYPGAAAVYRDLLKLHSDNGVWWMGLAVSLDAAGQTDAALSTYQQALGKAGMTPALTAYARQQLRRPPNPR